MNLFQRAKNILISPAKEWDIIAVETPDVTAIFTSYVLPLAIASAVAGFIGYGLIGITVLGYHMGGVNWGLYQAINGLVVSLCSVFITAFVVDALAPSFESEKDFGRSFQLVAYSYTAWWIGGLLQIIPVIALLGALFGIYGLYLMYVGLPKLKHTPEEKRIGYFLVTIIVLIVVYMIIGAILSAILTPLMGVGYDMPHMRTVY